MKTKENSVQAVKQLIERYSRPPEGRKKKIEVTHPEFDSLPKKVKALVQGVLKEVYRDDFEIIRKVFVEKLEFYLRLITDSLRENDCQDFELQEKLLSVREQIAEVVVDSIVDDEDIEWLRKHGFFPVDIFELVQSVDIAGLIDDLNRNIDEYILILGHQKYIVKILKFFDGFNKLKRIREFYVNSNSEIVEFSGSHLARIVRGSDWEDKLKYFEDEKKLQKLMDAGFNGSHLSQIVLGAGWEDKFKLVLTDGVLNILENSEITHNALAKLLMKKNWREVIGDLLGV